MGDSSIHHSEGSMEQLQTMSHYEEIRDDNLISYSDVEISSNRQSPLTWFEFKAIAISSLGGIIFGYDLGIISGALPQLKSSLGLTSSEQEMVVSFLYFGGGFGAAVGGSICDAYGRRKGILITDSIFILGGLVLCSAQTLPAILAGRIIMGVGVSVSGIADVAYLHEISPIELRGSIVSVNEACISLGFLLAYITSYFSNIAFPREGWRLMFGISVLISTLQFIGMCYMPESPVWLRTKGRIAESNQVLSTIRGTSAEVEMKPIVSIETSKVQDTVNDITINDNRRSISSSSSIREDQDNLSRRIYQAENKFIPEDSLEQGVMTDGLNEPKNNSLLSSSNVTPDITTTLRLYYRQIIITLFLAIAQNFCGQVNVLNFAPEIFNQVGLSNGESSLAPMLVLGAIKVITTSIVIWKVEQMRRTFLLKCGITTIFFSLLLLCFAFANHVNTEVNEESLEKMTKVSMWMAIVGVFGVVIGYSISFAPLTWLFVSEFFPPSIRGRALGGLSIVNFFAASLVSYTFLSVQKSCGPSVPFIIYALITVLSIGFAHIAIPDTSGKTPDKIAAELDFLWLWSSHYFRNLNSKDNIGTTINLIKIG